VVRNYHFDAATATLKLGQIMLSFFRFQRTRASTCDCRDTPLWAGRWPKHLCAPEVL